MRDFLDAILAFIGAESMTDDEYATITSTLPLYDQESYDDLSRILVSRESVSVYHDRLLGYYEARGVDIDPAETGKSNIFLGSTL